MKRTLWKLAWQAARQTVRDDSICSTLLTYQLWSHRYNELDRAMGLLFARNQAADTTRVQTFRQVGPYNLPS
jgi:hypothetical protein